MRGILEELGGGEPMIRIYCMKRKSVFNKRKGKNPKIKNYEYFLPIKREVS